MLQLELYSGAKKNQKEVIIGPLNRVHVIWGSQIDLIFPDYKLPKGLPAEAFEKLGDVFALYINCDDENDPENSGAVLYNGEYYSDFSIAPFGEKEKW